MSDIIYSESNGFIQLTVTAEGDNVRYEWMINDHLQMSSISGTLTILPLPPGMTRIVVNVSNKLGFDSKAMLIQIENGGTDSGPSDATPDQPGANEKRSRLGNHPCAIVILCVLSYGLELSVGMCF